MVKIPIAVMMMAMAMKMVERYVEENLLGQSQQKTKKTSRKIFRLFLTRSHKIMCLLMDRDYFGHDYMTLLLRHWYEIMALYYVKLVLTEISALRQDRRVLQKSKIIRIEFLSKWGMLQTSSYV